MAKSFSFGKIDLVASSEAAPGPAKPEPETLFRIAVLGDFSGRANHGLLETGTKLSARTPVLIDRDNFDEVMARLDVRLRLPVAGDGNAPVVLQFKELEDFHPDQIFTHTALFQALKETRRRLINPKSFDAAAAELRVQAAPEPAPVPDPQPAAAALSVNNEDLLSQILGEPIPVRSAAEEREVNPWGALVKEIVAPYAVAKASPRQGEIVASVDETTSRLMRKILHHPELQSLEAAWRGLFFLVRRLETDAKLSVSLIDVSKEELAADLTATDDPSATGLYKLLVDPTVNTPGGKPWALLVLDATFAPNDSDAGTLGRLATIARFAGAPVLAGASPRAVECTSFAETPDPDDWNDSLPSEDRESWNALRRLGDASFLGLALPRFLLRLPYGKKDTPTESFAFEELTADSPHDDYLWGNPAFALAELLGRSFREFGWGLRPGRIDEISGLPVHVRRVDGDAEATPCAEAILSHRAAERIQERGLIPVLSVQNQDAIRAGGFTSVAEPARPLSGRWRS